MNSEQKKVVRRCGEMLKAAFPDLTGYVRFDMCKGVENVKPCLHLNVENK